MSDWNTDNDRQDTFIDFLLTSIKEKLFKYYLRM